MKVFQEHVNKGRTLVAITKSAAAALNKFKEEHTEPETVNVVDLSVLASDLEAHYRNWKGAPLVTKRSIHRDEERRRWLGEVSYRANRTPQLNDIPFENIVLVSQHDRKERNAAFVALVRLMKSKILRSPKIIKLE